MDERWASLGSLLTTDPRDVGCAIEAGTSQLMPYYGMPVGTAYEEVGFGFGFNPQIITELLREQLGFDGIVCTDWQLLADTTYVDEPMLARAWGVEHLTPVQRTLKALDAGIDQFGGEGDPSLVLELLRTGEVSEARIEESVRRLLREKFVLGSSTTRTWTPSTRWRPSGVRTSRSRGRRAAGLHRPVDPRPDRDQPCSRSLPAPGSTPRAWPRQRWPGSAPRSPTRPSWPGSWRSVPRCPRWSTSISTGPRSARPSLRKPPPCWSLRQQRRRPGRHAAGTGRGPGSAALRPAVLNGRGPGQPHRRAYDTADPLFRFDAGR